jgi:hypothetical protein
METAENGAGRNIRLIEFDETVAAVNLSNPRRTE